MTNHALPKRLIEVDLPIKRISAHSRREKSIRHGHISTLHIWWARRPLAACRAIICAALWPDPADEHCPSAFREAAKSAMLDWARNHLALASADSFPRLVAIQRDAARLNDSLELRHTLLDFIADFANWDNSTVKEYLDTGRALTQVAHEALGGTTGTRPLVVDPFAGGGSIPLEALRVGADAFASDLNPIPVLLNKVILEYVPKYGHTLADAVQTWVDWMLKELRKRMSSFYPESEDGSPIGAYIWARTILSEAPTDDDYPVEVPLLRSMLLLKKKGRYKALRWIRDKSGIIETELSEVRYADGSVKKVRRPKLEVFQPLSLTEVEKGTSSGGAATCPLTGYTTSVESVRRQLSARRGGAADARLICVVATKRLSPGRSYLSPRNVDLTAEENAAKELYNRIRRHQESESLLPDGRLNHLRGFFNVVLYGMTTWSDLFSPRQLLGLTVLIELLKETLPNESNSQFKEAVQTCLALAIDRCADKSASLVVWDNTRDMATHVFGRQALPMIWDFAEVSFLSDNGWLGASEWVLKVINAVSNAHLAEGMSTKASATSHPLPDDVADAVVTDPPYYAAIPYADLSDFFYSWLKRSVGRIHPDLFSGQLSPKEDECVSLSHRAAMYRHKDGNWFEQMMTKACEEARRETKPSGIGVFVFANKETAGWEAMLGALHNAGWTITGSWPVDTEMGNRLRAQNSAALASSVHLVCRPRETSDGGLRISDIGDWRDVLSELPRRIHEWMPRLADEGVVGADAIFACLGPALEIFSRYSRVEKASGDVVTLPEYLEQVWGAVAKEALAQVFKEADTAGFEPDARLTAIWLWTLNAGAINGDDSPGDTEGADDQEQAKGKSAKAKGGFVLEYDAARKIAQGLGAHLEDLDHVVEISGESARLLPVSERTQHLFGKEQAEAPTGGRTKKSAQMNLFGELMKDSDDDTAWSEKTVKKMGETTLDRVHQAMILFAAGRGEALKRFLVQDGAGRDQGFWRLAQALSALYPASTGEKRWVDGVLARKKSLGL